MQSRFLILCLLLLSLWLVKPMAYAGPAQPPSASSPSASDPYHLTTTPRMRRYADTGYALYFLGTAYSVLVLWGILASGLSAKLRDWAARISSHWYLILPLYYIALSLVLAVFNIPLNVGDGFWLSHAYGLSHESFGAWLADEVKGWFVDRGTTIFALFILFALIRRSPRRWSLWFWAALIPLIAIGIFVTPLVVDPLFNKFTPLPPGPLRTQLESLAAKAGIPNAPIYVVDKSKQTDTTNAYVTGIGSSARIVLWDTTIQQFSTEEIVSIIGHEMGHYVLKHIYWGFAGSVLGLLIILPVLQKCAEWLVRRKGTRWRITGLTDPAAIPAFLLIVIVFSFLTDPITNGVSRNIEHQADAYGLHLTHDGPAMARVFVHFAHHDLSDPDPPAFIKFWLFSHPPLQERIDFVLGRS